MKLPVLAQLNKQHAENAQRAHEELAKLQREMKIKKEQDAQALKDKAKLRNEELARRAQLLRQQRELILKKKNQQRATELKEFQKETKEEADKDTQAAQNISDADAKRQAMRAALAKRFKQDMLEIKSKHAQQEADKYESLAKQLKTAETIRKELSQMEQEKLLAQEMKRQEELENFHRQLSLKNA